jgi:hypothetical protein
MKSEVLNRPLRKGFKRAGAWLLGFFWLGVVFAGMAIAFSPSSYPPALGWILLTGAAVFLILTTAVWVKIFPGLMAYGVFGSLLEISSGHALGHPEVRVTPATGTMLLLFFGISTALSLTFRRRFITALDRVALFLFVVCFFAQIIVPHKSLMILAFGLTCLASACSYHYVRSQKN